MNGGPRAEPLRLPLEYGRPVTTLPWIDVAARLATAPHYWLATVRPDNRPHTVPVDALWLDGRLWFGGSTGSVHHANLLAAGSCVVHTDDAVAPIIVEGDAVLAAAGIGLAEQLAERSEEKYGYAAPTAAYQAPMWTLTPQRVLAWTDFPNDGTRFVFD